MSGEYAAHTHPPLPHPSYEEIEGSTLSELEAQLLLDEGLAAKGKPLLHHQMNEDLRVAYKLANGEAKRNSPVIPCFLQRLNAAVMHSTGSVHSVVGGNGRTAHLLMNYMQFRSQLFPTKVFSEDHEEYFLSLRQSQDEGKSASFLTFMAQQLMKSLTIEIERFNVSEKKEFAILL